LSYARYMVLYIQTSFLFAMVMLIAEGWYIIHHRLETSKRTVIFVLPILYYVTACCTKWVHEYFLGLTIIVVIVIVVYIVRHCGFNILFLYRRFYDIQVAFRTNERHGISIEEFAAPLLAKLDSLRYLRFVFVTYCIAWAILSIVDGFLIGESWILHLCEEAIDGAFFILILCVFRLRSYRAFVGDAADREGGSNTGRRRANTQRDTMDVTLLEDRKQKPLAILVPIHNDLFREFLNFTVKAGTARHGAEQEEEEGAVGRDLAARRQDQQDAQLPVEMRAFPQADEPHQEGVEMQELRHRPRFLPRLAGPLGGAGGGGGGAEPAAAPVQLVPPAVALADADAPGLFAAAVPTAGQVEIQVEPQQRQDEEGEEESHEVEGEEHGQTERTKVENGEVEEQDGFVIDFRVEDDGRGEAYGDDGGAAAPAAELANAGGPNNNRNNNNNIRRPGGGSGSIRGRILEHVV